MRQKTSKAPKSGANRDPEITKVQILDAATEEFARMGLVGARTEAIAAQTGVTKAMIFYYFGSKEELYKAVLERAYDRNIEGISENLAELPPTEAFECFIRQLLDNVSKNPNIASILFLESIQNQGQYYPKQAAEQLYGVLSSILERGIAMGVFRPLEPRHTAVNIIGICVFYFCAHPNIKFLWSGKRMLSKEMLEQHANEALNLILAGVRN